MNKHIIIAIAIAFVISFTILFTMHFISQDPRTIENIETYSFFK